MMLIHIDFQLSFYMYDHSFVFTFYITLSLRICMGAVFKPTFGRMESQTPSRRDGGPDGQMDKLIGQVGRTDGRTDRPKDERF